MAQLEGLFLGLALGGIGAGMVLWARRFLPDEEHTEPRVRASSTEEQIAAFQSVFRAGEEALGRRRLLARLLIAALVAAVGALVFPVRSLGPRPGAGLKRTAYRRGVRIVTGDDEPVRSDGLPVGGVLTVWPEGHTHDADAPTLLIRLPRDVEWGDEVRAEWTVDGLIAYSKLCTHTGCPVGLYQQREQLLLCPCHQSTFEVLHGARPIFGPAVRPLPQLPLGQSDDGTLVALGDFPEPTGAGFWDAL
jgi:ubiquinol-cytochrome c reductase iron-sulfur subunit